MKTNKTRKFLESQYGRLYSFTDMDKGRMACVYCGDVRETMDHIPSLHSVDIIGAKTLREKEIEFKLVPCCKSCNATLGAKQLLTYEDRLLFLYTHLQNKLDRVTLWSQDEIDELGETLKQQVTARQMQIRRELLARLRGIERNLSKV